MQDAKADIQRRLVELKAFLAGEAPPRLSESDTKAHFIEPVIAALGWHGIGNVRREYYVKNSQEFIDYVLVGPEGPLLAIEAKSLHTNLTDKHAAQLIQYCAVEGIEWAALTNGRELQFFNSFLKPDLAAKRVLQVDLLAFNSDEEFETLFSQLWQMSRESMTTPGGVRTWLNQLRLDATLRAIVTDPGSPVVRQLRTALTNAEIRATSQDVVQWFLSHLQPSVGAIPQPIRMLDNAGNANAGKPLAAGSTGIAGDRDATTAGQALFQSLRTAVDHRLPGTVWRETKSYVAAVADGATYLAVRVQRNRLIVGLALPADTDARNLHENTSQFNWPRITRVTFIDADADVNDALLAHVVAAQKHAALGQRLKTHHGVALPDLLGGGYLKPDSELILMGPGGREITRARLLASGEIAWQGQRYRSLSDRAFARLLGRQSLNGWIQWRTGPLEGSELLADIRARMQSAAEA